MTDATPVNRYLLFSRSDDFRTFDKVSYALKHNSLLSTSTTATPAVGGSALSHDLDRHILIKSVDDVKRHFLFGDRIVPLTPATGNSVSFSAPYEAAALDELDSASLGVRLASSPLVKVSDDGTETSPLLLEETQDIDAKPWDDPGAKGNYWSWPIESLYQHYHLTLAIDFGQASFDVSENGTVFIDRVPSIVESLLHVLRTTIDTRDEDVAHCRRWLQTNVVDERLRAQILSQLWHPKIRVTIVMLNAPQLPSDALTGSVMSPFRGTAKEAAPRKADSGGGESATTSGTSSRRIVLFPTEHASTAFMFTSDESGTSGSNNNGSNGAQCTSCIPLLSSCDARLLLEDEDFPDQLQEALQQYEDACRRAGPAVVQNWPQSSLSGSLEYLIRTTPEGSQECFSIVLVNNTASLSCSESLSFLESTVRRKNIILSVVSLNRRTHFDSAELSPLSQFLFSVGGFAVHVDYWLAMATARLNRDWCHRFEGARCVAQQLFVHLVAAFPVSSHGITRGATLSPEKDASVVLYDGDHDLPDQVWSGPTISLVQMIGASRFNEGWSVLIDYKDESTEAIVVARHHHTFHSGSLTLHYELRMNRPVAYRQVRLTGTKALVEYFCRLHTDPAWREQSIYETGASWFLTLSILHAQLDSWMRAEQVVMQLLDNPTRFTLSRELHSLTNAHGLAVAWVNVCTVRALSIFVQYDARVLYHSLAQTSPALARYGNGGVAVSGSCAAASCTLLRSAMLREGHLALSDGDDLTFMRLRDDGLPLYVAQCIPFTDANTDKSRASANSTSSGGGGGNTASSSGSGGVGSSGSGGNSTSGHVLLAGGFECRMSFFCSTAAEEDKLVAHLVQCLNGGGGGGGGAGSATTTTDTPAASDISPTSAAEKKPPRDERRLVLRAAYDPQSLLLVEMVTQRRSVTLLASLSFPRAPSAMPPPSAELQGRQRLEYDPLFGRGGSVGGTSIVQYFRRAGRVPYAVASAQLLEVYVASWTFGSPETFADFGFAEETFFLAVLRRLHRGFTLLYCNATSLKAILHFREAFDHWSGPCTVSVHDVLEVRDAPGGGGGMGTGAGGHVLTVQRCVSPHFYVGLPAKFALRDIREDFHLATALQSYRVCATVPDSPSPMRSAAGLRALQKAGTLLTTVHLESLVRYLSPAHTTCIELTSPRSLRVSRGTDLRARIMELLRSLGDRSASIAVTQFSSDYVRLLTRGSEAVPRNFRIQTSILAPLRNQTLTALLVLEKDTPSGDETHSVTVAVASMDLALLRYGLVRQYAPGCGASLTDCAVDRTVLQSLQHLLLTFTSLHTTQQLIHRLNQSQHHNNNSHNKSSSSNKEDEKERADDASASPTADDAAVQEERRELEQEIMKSYSFMRTYTVEADLTHLLHALRLKPAPSITPPALVKQTLAALLDGFTTHATPRSELFFPFCSKGNSSTTTNNNSNVSGQPGGASSPPSKATSSSLPPLSATASITARSPSSLPSSRAANDKDNNTSGAAGGESAPPSLCGFPTVIRIAATLSSSTDKNAPTTTFWVSETGDMCDGLSGATTSSSSPPPEGLRGTTTTTTLSSPAAAAPPAIHGSQLRLRVRLFVKTLPREVSSLFRGADVDGLNLAQAPVRELLRNLIIRYSTGRPGVAADPLDADFSGNGHAVSERDIERMQGLCAESSGAGEPLESILKGLQTRLVTTVARYCMTRAFHTAAFQRLGQLVLAPEQSQHESAPPVDASKTAWVQQVDKTEKEEDDGHVDDEGEDGGEAPVPCSEGTAPARALAADGSSHGKPPTATGTTAAGQGQPLQRHSPHDVASVRKSGDLSFLAQFNSTASRAMREDKELATLLRRVVLPSLASAKQFVADSFPIAFTQQATDYRSIDPVTATTDVFRRCVEEDNMGVIAVAHHLSYAYIPNATYFGERWVAVLVEPTAPDSAQSTASILCYEPAVPPCLEERLGAAITAAAAAAAAGEAEAESGMEETGRRTDTTTATSLTASSAAAVVADTNLHHDALRTVTEKLRSHINAKVTQVSQLHLLRQLRDTQFANAELIPDNWGNQFRSLAFATSRMGEDAYTSLAHTPPTDANGGASQFYLRGSNVLSIPIYYKLQHQCKKVLQRITANCSRLELIQIFNRDQCFVVADDVEGDTFHYIRLVFSKDIGTSTSVATFPPQVVGTDRYSKLVVQLFTATTNASIKRPLQKLQDFCYFLAVQELQGHVNYVQHKMISFNDLVFLQNQKLDPITLDLRQILKANATGPGGDASERLEHGAYHHPPDDVSNDNITAFAMALLFLNLRDNKFKLFEIQRDQSHAISNFVEHYNLEEGLRNDAGDSTTPATTTDGALRFVKLVDGLTDVLVSCAIVPDRARCAIVVERYTTKVPSERYTSGESESSILKQLDSYVNDTITQLHFYAQTLLCQHITEHAVPSLVHSLLATSQAMRSTESLFLRHAHLSLDEVCPSVYPFLVERLCGALSAFDPCCLQVVPRDLDDDSGPPAQAQAVEGFPWRWKEWLQNEPRVDDADFYVVCGFTVDVVDASGQTAAGGDAKARKQKTRKTRVIPYVRRDLLVSTMTTEESHSVLLAELGLASKKHCTAYIVLNVSLNKGISTAVFNLRDTDFLLRLLGDVVQEMEVKSTLLNDVLLQRLGYSIPSAFDEAGLARNCCGDATNVIQSKPLSISAASYRRRVNHVRFRPSLPPEAQEEALVVIVEGLFNRGLIVNYAFPIDDAICCLYEECPRDASLAACSAIVESLIEDGYLVEEPTSALRPQVSLDVLLPRRSQKRRAIVNCRLADIAGVPADALIACDYHRHILSAHVIVEAQNARSGVSESLARLNTLWRTGASHHLHEFTRIIVQLQLKSKEVFASRVPEFQLRRESWVPGDDLLDPDLPAVDQQSHQYAAPINEVLHNYMNRLRRLYPSMLVIEVSPNDQRYREDPVVTSRLQCRYGKVTGSDGETAVFCPNMYYGVLPIAELVDRHRTAHDRFAQPLPASLLDATESAPITNAGLLVVEVGFQVVHYALDFFVIKGERLPPGVEAGIASEFKQNLMFDRAVYDAAVRRYIGDIRAPAVAIADRPAQQPLAVAITNLVKHHPTPPQCSCSAAMPFRITDPNVLRVKSLSSSSPSAASAGNANARRAAGAVAAKTTSTLGAGPLRGGGGTSNAGSGNDISVPAGGTAAAAAASLTAGASPPNSKVTLLVPNPNTSTCMLTHAPTGERYLYGGLIDWDSQTLYVLVTPVRLEVASDYATEHHGRSSTVANGLMPLIVQAKHLLFTQLLESTQHERVNAAREKFLFTHRCPSGGVLTPALARQEAPTYDELELVIRNSHRVLLQGFRPVIQQAVEPVEWSGDATLLRRAQEVLFPDYVLRVIRRGSASRSDGKVLSVDAVTGSGATAAAAAGLSLSPSMASDVQADVGLGDRRHPPSAVAAAMMSNSNAAGTPFSASGKPTVGGFPLSRLFQGPALPDDEFVATFARTLPPSDYFLVVRCVKAPAYELSAVLVEDTYLCCRSAPSIMWSHAGAVTVLSNEQTALLDTFVELLANCIWSSIVPHTSQAS